MSASLDELLKFFWDLTRGVPGISILTNVAAKLLRKPTLSHALFHVDSVAAGRTQLVAHRALIR